MNTAFLSQVSQLLKEFWQYSDSTVVNLISWGVACILVGTAALILYFVKRRKSK